jgi:hypothetical protein
MCDAMDPAVASIIVNADDWGRDVPTTDRSLECVLQGAVSSVSAMVFMEDSERAANLATMHCVDAGLHLNFTLAYSALYCPARLMEHQGKIARFLNTHRLASAIYHPGLATSFEYVDKRQFEEYERLYGSWANRVDGHHHMHLCANVARHQLIPSGAIVRRNLSFGPGEKGYVNRAYRRRQDRALARRHRMTDFFFDLQPLESRHRLAGIVELATRFDVEVETHPIRHGEYNFLMSGELLRDAVGVEVSRGYILRFGKSSSGESCLPLAQQTWR